MKHTLEDLIECERAAERACVRLLTQASRYDTAGNKNAAEACMREYRAVSKGVEIITQSKGRLQALAEHACICKDGFGMNLSCPVHSKPDVTRGTSHAN